MRPILEEGGEDGGVPDFVKSGFTGRLGLSFVFSSANFEVLAVKRKVSSQRAFARRVIAVVERAIFQSRTYLLPLELSLLEDVSIPTRTESADSVDKDTSYSGSGEDIVEMDVLDTSDQGEWGLAANIGTGGRVLIPRDVDTLQPPLMPSRALKGGSNKDWS